jgi:hypothetical protein
MVNAKQGGPHNFGLTCRLRVALHSRWLSQLPTEPLSGP